VAIIKPEKTSLAYRDQSTPHDQYRMRLVDKVFDVLEAFDADNRELSLQEIVNRTGQSKSGAYRILVNLTRRGVVDRDSLTRRYRIGTKLHSLGSLVSLDVRRLGLPYMEKLHVDFGSTVNLSIRDGGATVLVEVLDGGRPFQMSASVGSREPLHCTASGKCLLAFADSSERERLLLDIELVAYTPSTLTTVSGLRAELDLVRERGFALDRGEYVPYGRCLAVPLFDRRAQTCAALSLSGPEALLSSDMLPGIVDAMIDVGARLSEELGSPLEYPSSGAPVFQ
jgi:DNA-binding IclR family transcriptional regulator